MLQNSLDPNHYHPSPTHEEAMARLQFLVENRRRAGLLLGESGSGKSMVLRRLAQRLKREGCQTAIVNLVGLEVDELLWQVAVQLGLNPACGLPRYVMWRLITDRFCENRHQQIATVIMLDDAERASGKLVHHVHRLVHADCSPESCLTVVFAASLSEVSSVDERLFGLSELRIELEPWRRDDIADYLKGCLSRLGRSEISFDSAAVDRLAWLSNGIPRRVHQMAELAVLAACDRRATSIDGDTVETLYEELGIAAVH